MNDKMDKDALDNAVEESKFKESKTKNLKDYHQKMGFSPLGLIGFDEDEVDIKDVKVECEVFDISTEKGRKGYCELATRNITDENISIQEVSKNWNNKGKYNIAVHWYENTKSKSKNIKDNDKSLDCRL